MCHFTSLVEVSGEADKSLLLYNFTVHVFHCTRVFVPLLAFYYIISVQVPGAECPHYGRVETDR